MRASVTVVADWCMGHRLPNHGGKCYNLHGHQYTAEATVEGEISENRGAADEGMVLDFSVVKGVLKDAVRALDHKFLLFNGDPLVGSGLTGMYNMPGVELVPWVPTAENIGRHLLEQLPEGVTKIRVWETPTSYADVWR